MRNHLKIILGVVAAAFVATLIWRASLPKGEPAAFAPERTAHSALLAEATPNDGVDVESGGGGGNAQGTLIGSRRALFRNVRGEAEPAVNAKVFLLADLETGETYAAKNADFRWPVASLTKLMTAAEALREVPADAKVTLPQDMLPLIGDRASDGLSLGETYQAHELITAMMVFSSNEAAEGLASFAGRDGFLEAMNEKARAWGLAHTYFEDPTGLSAANQSTALDLKTATLRFYRDYPELFALTRKTIATLSEETSGASHMYQNINEFAGRADFLGGKTGFTDEAGGNLISLFAYENRPIIIIVLGSDDRFGATRTLLDWFTHSYSSR